MSVGYKLYREVLHFAPEDLSPAELVIALVIADDANDDTRESWIALRELSRRSRMPVPSIRRALGNLGKRKLEFRVSHGQGRDGREVYAVRGHAVDYKVPEMPIGDQMRSPFEAIGDQMRSPSGRPVDNERRSDPMRKAIRSALKGDHRRSPLSSYPLTNPSLPTTPVVPPSVEGSPNGHGGAARQPIELEAWLASLEARRLGRHR